MLRKARVPLVQHVDVLAIFLVQLVAAQPPMGYRGGIAASADEPRNADFIAVSVRVRSVP